MLERDRAVRRGRRFGVIAFALPVAGITALWTAQIIGQVWFPAPEAAPLSCRAGVLELTQTVRRARLAAAQEPKGERAALESFRTALTPKWQTRSELAKLCRGDELAEQALKRLDALRYAEEHAVRYEAVALAEQRRRTDAIARELLGANRE